jgi:A/G-specific adenine glycosylase
MNPKAFRRRLVAWFRRHGRDLPWRRTREAYPIVVSEFMLQQTQVSRVLDYWPRFLRRYPSLEHLARARPSQVREAWSGLGYYRRADNLHRLARVVVREMDGRIPVDVERLKELPGVGSYTAGAVACFAYERPAATVDTNVARVLFRYFGERGNGGTGERKRRLESLALSLQPRAGSAAWSFNQAMMELGALVCTARNPKCASCPVRAGCRYEGRATPK